MKQKTLNYLRRGLLWPIAFVNNFIHTVVGITDPRGFLIYTFSYCPKSFLYPQGYSKFRIWFDTTNFGWYWLSSSYYNNIKIRRSKKLQWLLRCRWIFIIPTEALYCLVETDWCDKDWKMITKAHLRYIWKVLIDGNYDAREGY